MYDPQGHIINASQPWLNSTDVSHFIDLKGRPLLKKLQKNALPRDGEFAVFRLDRNMSTMKSRERTTRLGFFIPLPGWNMCLGSALDVSALSADEQLRIQRIINEMQSDFAKLRIARTGFVMLFDSLGRLLIPPGPNVPAAVVKAPGYNP